MAFLSRAHDPTRSLRSASSRGPAQVMEVEWVSGSVLEREQPLADRAGALGVHQDAAGHSHRESGTAPVLERELEPSAEVRALRVHQGLAGHSPQESGTVPGTPPPALEAEHLAAVLELPEAYSARKAVSRFQDPSMFSRAV